MKNYFFKYHTPQIIKKTVLLALLIQFLCINILALSSSKYLWQNSFRRLILVVYLKAVKNLYSFLSTSVKMALTRWYLTRVWLYNPTYHKLSSCWYEHTAKSGDDSLFSFAFWWDSWLKNYMYIFLLNDILSIHFKGTYDLLKHHHKISKNGHK